MQPHLQLIHLFPPSVEKFALEVPAQFEASIQQSALHEISAREWKYDPLSYEPLVVAWYFGLDPEWDTAMAGELAQLIHDRADGRSPLSVLPVAPSEAFAVPPFPMDDVVAVSVGDGGEEFRRRVLSMLGLRIRPSKSCLFLSHRKSDGGKLAQQICDYFKTLGFAVFLDTDREEDKFPNMAAGERASGQLLKRLDHAAVVVVLDTPQAPSSKWVNWEIDEATAKVLPRFPILINPAQPSSPKGRFPALESINYRIKLNGIDLNSDAPLSSEALALMREQLEDYLIAVCQRQIWKVKRTRDAFTDSSWSWKKEDTRRSLYHAWPSRYPHEKAVACCALEDYFPDDLIPLCLDQWKNEAQVRHRYLFYDGNPVSAKRRNELAAQNVIVYHYDSVPSHLSKRLKQINLLLDGDFEDHAGGSEESDPPLETGLSASPVTDPVGRTGAHVVWLSGAVPAPEQGGNAALDLGILEFVRSLAAHVFEAGGRILHGSHPTFVQVLLDQARIYRETSGTREKPLTLMVSGFFGTPENMAGWEQWREHAEVIVTPTQGDRPSSLNHLRDEMAKRASAFVAIGGKWPASDGSGAGVPEEMNRALNRDLPSFAITGFGGAIDGYLYDHPNLYERMNNGLDRDENERLANLEDVGSAVGTILDALFPTAP